MAAELATVIMAHPSREGFVKELLDQLPVSTEVVWDQINDRWDTGRRTLLHGALLARARGCSHVLLVQDDAVLCKEFFEAATAACGRTGEHPVSFYLGSLTNHNPALIRIGAMNALRNGIPWVQMAGPWWGVSFAVPVEHVHEIVKLGDKRSDIPNFDTRVATWYREQDITCWYVIPSLVDHRGVDENPSLIAGRTADRHAKWYIGQGDPARLQWDRDPVVVHGRRPGVESGAMAFVIIDGEGTYRVGRWLFKPGATEVPADDPVLEFIRDRAPRWVTVQETREAPALPPEPEPEPEPKPAPLEPYQSRKDDQWYFVHHISGLPKGPFETQEAAAEASEVEAVSVPMAEDVAKTGGAGSGTLTLDEMPEQNKDGYGCPECGERYRTSAERDNHRRIRHPESFRSREV